MTPHCVRPATRIHSIEGGPLAPHGLGAEGSMRLRCCIALWGGGGAIHSYSVVRSGSQGERRDGGLMMQVWIPSSHVA